MRLWGCLLAGLYSTALAADEGILRLNANSEGNRKLRNSQYGRLEVWHDGSWGTICDLGFNTAAADVACKELGYRENGWHSNYYKVHKGNLGNLNVESGRPVHYSNFECSGDERDILDCPHIGWFH